MPRSRRRRADAPAAAADGATPAARNRHVRADAANGDGRAATGSPSSAASPRRFRPTPTRRSVAVVTGGCGFVGRHLVDRLRVDPRFRRVVVLDVVPMPTEFEWVLEPVSGGPAVSYQRCDVTDAAAVRTAFQGAFDGERAAADNDVVVFHLAAIIDTRGGPLHSARLRSVNVGGTRNVVEACRSVGVNRLIFLSSSSAVDEGRKPRGRRRWRLATLASTDEQARRYAIGKDPATLPAGAPASVIRMKRRGETEPSWDEGGFDLPVSRRKLISLYGQTKAEAEELVLCADGCSTGGGGAAAATSAGGVLRTVALRPHMVFGHRDNLSTDLAVLSPGPDWLVGASLRIGRGANTCTAVYVENLVHWLILADGALREQGTRVDDIAGRAFFVSNGHDGHMTMRAYLDMLLSCRGKTEAPSRATSSRGVVRSVFAWICAAVFLPRLVALVLAHLVIIVDVMTCGTRRWTVFQLTPAAVRHATSHLPLDCSRAMELLKYSAPFSAVEAVAEIRRRYHVGPRSNADARASVASVAPLSPAVVNSSLPVLGRDSRIFQSTRLRGLYLRNRVVKAATFEGMCPDGVPSDELIRFHAEVASGGAGLTTVAYVAVSADGRSFPNQLLVSERSSQKLAELATAVHDQGGAVSVQLTHAGYFARSAVIGTTPLGASRVWNPANFGFPRVATAEDINRIAEDFSKAARLCVRAGVDAVEVHCGHGYLLSQFISPYTNRRTDEFGGSLARRLKFPLDVLRRVRAAIGDETPMLVKMNMHDGFRGGLEVPEAVQCGRAFEAAGADVLIPSCGFVSRAGLAMLRGPSPIGELASMAEGRAWSFALRLFGPIFAPSTTFNELFLEEAQRALLAETSSVHICLIGGVSTLERAERGLRDAVPPAGDEQAGTADPRDGRAFTFVAMARALLREPDMVHRGRAQAGAGGAESSGAVGTSPCDHCNRCVALIEQGSGIFCANRAHTNEAQAE